MKVLVTGAAGFLGRHVVAALSRRGHRVRALVRPSGRTDGLGWGDRVEVVRADLRAGPLGPAFEGVDVLVHLAARVKGDAISQMADTVVGTERLLEAMAGSTVRRLVLASSFSVYDWSAARGALTEESPLEERDLYRRDGYAIAKTWQERTVRRLSREHGWGLTVLRPGFIWGRDHEYLAGLGQQLGRWHLVFGPSTYLPLTHVENCADCFARAVEGPRAIGETFNVVDGHDVRIWHYLGEYLRRTGAGGVRVPVPYRLALLGPKLADGINRRFCGDRARLPGLLVPCRFRARFKPLRFSNRKLRDVLDWRPPLDFAACLERTYGAGPRGEAHPSAETETETARRVLELPEPRSTTHA